MYLSPQEHQLALRIKHAIDLEVVEGRMHKEACTIAKDEATLRRLYHALRRLLESAFCCSRKGRQRRNLWAFSFTKYSDDDPSFCTSKKAPVHHSSMHKFWLAACNSAWGW